MFSRVAISLFFVGVGLGSPWLVRDWLESSSGGARVSREPGIFASLQTKVKSVFAGDSESKTKRPEKADVASERSPFPLASQTARIVEGFVSPPGGGEGGLRIPFFGSGSVAQTPRTIVITREAGAKMSDDLLSIGAKVGDPVFLRLFKEEQELEIWMNVGGEIPYVLYKVLRFTDCAGEPGPKMREGDGQAPEGFYFGTASSLRPETRHHLGIDLGYPNAFDLAHGRTGGDMMIHGGLSAAGAFSLSREGIEEVYTLTEAAIRGGQKVVRFHLFPFRMTDQRMETAWKSRPSSLEFWMNLKEGYDFFENAGMPPNVGVEAGRYVFRFEGE
jgi:murein L,D-transpeptidase YafK